MSVTASEADVEKMIVDVCAQRAFAALTAAQKSLMNSSFAKATEDRSAFKEGVS